MKAIHSKCIFTFFLKKSHLISEILMFFFFFFKSPVEFPRSCSDLSFYTKVLFYKVVLLKELK